MIQWVCNILVWEEQKIVENQKELMMCLENQTDHLYNLFFLQRDYVW